MPSPLFNAISSHDYEKAREFIETDDSLYRKEQDNLGNALTPLEFLDQLNTVSPKDDQDTAQRKSNRKDAYLAFRSFLQEKILGSLLDTLARAYGRCPVKRPYYFASVLNNYRNSIELLIEEKPESTNKRGWNVFHFIAQSGHVELLDSLKNKITPEVFNTLINQQTSSSGLTPLMMVINQGNFPFVKALIEANASVDVKDKQGKTALDLLRMHSGHEVTEIHRLLSQRETAKSSSFSAIQETLGNNRGSSPESSQSSQLYSVASNTGKADQTPAMKKSTSRFNNALREIENTGKFPQKKFDRLLTLMKNGADPTGITYQRRNVLHYLYLLGTEEQRNTFKNAIPSSVLATLEKQKDRNGKTPSELLHPNHEASSSHQASASNDFARPSASSRT